MRRPRLVVTGFSGFPGAPRNPTQALIDGLDAGRLARRLEIELTTMVLPTEYAAARELVPALWRDIEPDAVVHFGLSGRARRVHVETRARNHVSPVRADAAGRRPRHPAILPDGPAVRRATLPTARMVAALMRRGVPAALSGDAGAYLCNFVTYLSLGLAPAGARAGFIHLPWPAECRAPAAPRERPGWRALETGVTETIAVAAMAARRGVAAGSIEVVVQP